MILIDSKVFYIKKILCIALCLLFILAGCSSKSAAQKIEGRPSNDALITIGGEAVLTVKDYNYLVIHNKISHEQNGAELLDEETLFKTEAEYACAAFLAKLFDTEADMDAMYEEYDNTVLDLTSNLDTEALKYNAVLRNALGMTDEEFRDWCVNYYYVRTSANNLIKDIGDSYANITNPDAMSEEIVLNLRQMLSDYGFECSFDGYTGYIPDFSNIV